MKAPYLKKSLRKVIRGLAARSAVVQSKLDTCISKTSNQAKHVQKPLYVHTD